MRIVKSFAAAGLLFSLTAQATVSTDVVTNYQQYRVNPQHVLFTAERTPQFVTHDTQFPEVVGWGQVVTLSATQKTTEVAKVEIRKMQLIRLNPKDGRETIVATLPLKNANGSSLPCTVDAQGQTFGTCWGANYSRTCLNGSNRYLCWFTRPELTRAMTNSSISRSILTIDVAKTPNAVPHFWTIGAGATRSASWRTTSQKGYEYFVFAEFKVTGKAAINFGQDRWRATSTCPPNYVNEELDQPSCLNKQSWYSIWVGDTKGNWVAGRFPLKYMK